MKNESSKSIRLLLALACILLACVIVIQCLFIAGVFPVGQGNRSEEVTPPTSFSGLDREGYKLEQVVVLSRHNIRSPLSGAGSALGTITPHEWFSWSSNPSELSLRGGILETEMGQFFRKWLEENGLFPENYHPDENAVRIYSNSKQRTIATSRYFTAGLLPTANVEIETHVEYDTME